MKIDCDINSSQNTIKKFCTKSSVPFNAEDFDGIFELYFKEHDLSFLNRTDFIENEYCILDDISEGDIVQVSYFPFSQKYMWHYLKEEFIGKVLFVDDED